MSHCHLAGPCSWSARHLHCSPPAKSHLAIRFPGSETHCKAQILPHSFHTCRHQMRNDISEAATNIKEETSRLESSGILQGCHTRHPPVEASARKTSYCSTASEMPPSSRVSHLAPEMAKEAHGDKSHRRYPILPLCMDSLTRILILKLSTGILPLSDEQDSYS